MFPRNPDTRNRSRSISITAFEKMGRNDVENMLIIGDSLTSDIRGGNNAGIDTLWYNPHHQENTAGVHVDYETDTLEKIGEMLS